MTTRYFTGQSVTGSVQAHHCTSFKSMVDQLIMVPQVLAVKYATYHALKARAEDKSLPLEERKAAKAEADRAKEVPYLTPAIFDQSPSPRNTEHATVCNLVCLDIDHGGAVFVRSPDTLARQLAPWSYVAYTTASSTKAAPRIRIIVDAEGIPKEDYPAAVRTVAARMGLKEVTPESLKAPQPMYLPSVFKDQGEGEHPVFSHRLDGQAFTVDDIGDPSVPTEERKRERPVPGGADVLEYLRAPVPEVTLEVATAALYKLDPDMPRPQWLEMAAGLKHQFDGEQEDKAYALFDGWSRTGDKYEGPEDTATQWRSFRVSPAGRLPVTIRTLLFRALSAGWDGGKVRADVFGRVKAWITEPGRTATELTGEGLRHIAAAPLLSSAQEDMLMQLICTRAKDDGLKVGVPALRKDLFKLREQIKSKDRPEDSAAPKWALGWCYVTGHDEFFRHQTGEKIKPQAFDRAYSRYLLPTEKDLLAAGVPITEASLSRPTILPVQYLTNTLEVLTVHGYDYDPGKPGKLHFTDEQGKIFANTYVRTFPEVNPSGAKEAGRIFMGHLERLIREPENRRILMDWLAYIVQHPGVKIRWVPLIQGAEGCGKMVIADAMAAVLGKQHVKPLEGSALFSGWTEWATGYQLVAIDEVLVDGANRLGVMNVLKPLITNDTISVNEKFENNRKVRNLTNYILFTNHRVSLVLTPGDRRYFVLESAMQTIEEVKSLPFGYFDRFYAMLAENAGGLRHFLLNWQISDTFRPNAEAPDTIYRHRLIQHSANEPTACLRQVLTESENVLMQPDLLSSRLLLEALRHEGLGKLTAQGLGKVLLEDGYTHAGRWLLNGVQHNMWVRNNSHFTEALARDEAFARARLAEEVGVGAHLLL